ncbi:hypothetical protein EYF80_056669 [Liparis tanakae]|uniref:Uncharacterized protein n=1 Tax=Liparis tanakae TaxID=230148 RepID=A0A4Z2EWB7_9TELE|nr:hypothetical protein EYF80_056669 [Liparis tanakae]
MGRPLPVPEHGETGVSPVSYRRLHLCPTGVSPCVLQASPPVSYRRLPLCPTGVSPCVLRLRPSSSSHNTLIVFPISGFSLL